jgi:predicted GNAT superfamily acetyltransferase
VETRPLTTHAEYEACVDLQRAIWGSDFRELVAPAMLKIAQKVGGICVGTYEREQLLGFVYGLTGYVDGEPLHWSHMLAVRVDARDHGIGRALKEFQRDHLRAAKIHRMLWTFDPLVSRNAHLNLNRLGARVVEYVPDMYGANPMSKTDSVIGTDRFVVEWDLDTTTVPSEPRSPEDAAVLTLAGTDETTTPPTIPEGPSVLVEVPEDIQMLKHTEPNEARAWRRLLRAAFLRYADLGYTVEGLVRDRRAGRAFYCLQRPSP